MRTRARWVPLERLSSRRLLRELRPAVPQRDGAIEDQRPGLTVPIDGKVPQTLELDPRSRPGPGETGLDRAVRKRLERVRIQVVQKRLALRGALGVLDGKQSIVQSDDSRDRMLRGHPVQRRFDAPAIG